VLSQNREQNESADIFGISKKLRILDLKKKKKKKKKEKRNSLYWRDSLVNVEGRKLVKVLISSRLLFSLDKMMQRNEDSNTF